MAHYEAIAGSIKIASRSLDTRQIEIVLDAYVTGRSPGNLFFLLESGCLASYLAGCQRGQPGATRGLPVFDSGCIPDDFFERVTACDRVCDGCTYCGDIGRQAFRQG